MSIYKRNLINRLIKESLVKNMIEADKILKENLSTADYQILLKAAGEADKNPKAQEKAVKSALRKLFKTYHPDFNPYPKNIQAGSQKEIQKLFLKASRSESAMKQLTFLNSNISNYIENPLKVQNQTVGQRKFNTAQQTARAQTAAEQHVKEQPARKKAAANEKGMKAERQRKAVKRAQEKLKQKAPEKPATGTPKPTTGPAKSGGSTGAPKTATPKATAGAGGTGGAAPKITPKASAKLPSSLGKYYAFTPEGGSINRPYSGETYKKLFGTPDSKSLVSTTTSKIPVAQQNVRVYQVIEQSSKQVKLIQVNPNTGKPIPNAKPISRTLSIFKDMSPLKANKASWFNQKFNPLSKDYRGIKSGEGDIIKMIQKRAKGLASGNSRDVRFTTSNLKARGIDIESLSAKKPSAPGPTTGAVPKTSPASGGGGQVTAKVPPNANTNPTPITKVTPAEIAKVKAHPQGGDAIKKTSEALTKLLPAAPVEVVEKAAEKIVTNSWKDVAKQTLGKGLDNLKNVKPRTVIGGAALSAAMPFIERYALGSGEDVTAGEVVYSVGTGMVITAISVAFPPAGLALAAGAIIMGGLQYWDAAVGDMSNVWERIKREGEKKVGFATEGGTRDVWAPSGGSPGWFFKQKDFWQYVDKKFPGQYTGGVLKPGDLGKEEAEKILLTMYIMKAARRDPEQKPLLSDILAGKNLTTHPAAHDFNAMHNCFVYGYLDQDAWFVEYKKNFPKPGPIEIDVIKEEGGEEGKTGVGEGEGGETITDPGDKVTKKFDWDKYVGNDPVESDKQQIKALWIQSVAEKVGSKKSFGSWAKWYNNLYTKGEIGVDNQKLEDGQVLGGSGKNKSFKAGRHLSPDQVEFIMRKMYKGQAVPTDLGPIKESKIIISKSNLERILKVI